MRARVEERMAFPWAVKEPLLKETNGRCAHCGEPLDRYTNLTVDHVIPLNKGGTNDPANLTVLCEDCNTEKSDMVLLPMSWYPYLSANRRKALTEHMKKYMKETDYLAEDCLMPVDEFRLDVPVSTCRKMPNGTVKVMRMPAYIYGERMKRDDAFAWLMEYKKSLQYRDACGVFSSPSDFTAPCYMLKKSGIELAMVNPWMLHVWNDEMNNYNNEILIDWFFSPALPEKDHLPAMLAHMVYEMEQHIVDNISKTMEGACMVLFRNRCFVSDRHCKAVFDKIIKGRNNETDEFSTKHSTLTARIRELVVFHIMGERKARNELEKKMKRMNPSGFTSVEDAMKENAELNKRLSG